MQAAAVEAQVEGRKGKQRKREKQQQEQRGQQDDGGVEEPCEGKQPQEDKAQQQGQEKAEEKGGKGAKTGPSQAGRGGGKRAKAAADEARSGGQQGRQGRAAALTDKGYMDEAPGQQEQQHAPRSTAAAAVAVAAAVADGAALATGGRLFGFLDPTGEDRVSRASCVCRSADLAAVCNSRCHACASVASAVRFSTAVRSVCGAQGSAHAVRTVPS